MPRHLNLLELRAKCLVSILFEYLFITDNDVDWIW
jgi:hypothetical protein